MLFANDGRRVRDVAAGRAVQRGPAAVVAANKCAIQSNSNATARLVERCAAAVAAGCQGSVHLQMPIFTIASGVRACERWCVCVLKKSSLHHKNAISIFIIEINSIAKWPMGSSVAQSE